MTEWDSEGRPLAWVTSRQPEFDAEDRAVVVALLDLEGDTCDGCGELLSESLHWDHLDDPKYSSHYVVCMGCMAREQGIQKKEKEDAAAEKSGRMVFRSARKWVLKREDLTGG